jgi:MFS family permease
MSPRLLPRERYGQFLSANYIFGMVGLTLTPPLVGWLLQQVRDYRYVFIFCGVLTSLSLVALTTLYFQWMRHGGDRNFTPPDPVRKTPVPGTS